MKKGTPPTVLYTCATQPWCTQCYLPINACSATDHSINYAHILATSLMKGHFKGRGQEGHTCVQAAYVFIQHLEEGKVPPTHPLESVISICSESWGNVRTDVTHKLGWYRDIQLENPSPGQLNECCSKILLDESMPSPNPPIISVEQVGVNGDECLMTSTLISMMC